jgi:predicted chitinase
MFYTGVVENRSDPLNLGRCQVRIVGLHTHDKNQLPTNELPWATPIQPVTSAAMNGIGMTPIGPVEGTTVIITFTDEDQQFPLILGTVGGISKQPVAIDDDDSGEITERTKDIELRTIVGPVTGKKLTFIDKENGRLDLTRSLKANMKVVGFGLPKETFIVSIDSGTEITISEFVTGYGENIIKFEDAPTNLAAVATSKVEGVLTTSTGQPVLSSDDKPIKVGETPVVQTATNIAIPTIPPKKASPNESKSKDGIKALIAACDKVGLTTKEQKCALLGIAGGESRWIPQKEAYVYSEGRMKQIYSFATEADIKKYSNADKKGVTREEFFSWAYGPTTRGKGFLGNQTDIDGGKYYGRGFIQLTGRANYQRYQNLATQLGLNVDIVNNPDSLDDDINTSAIIAALYIKDRVPKSVSSTAHPGYFLAAKKAVGVNSPDISALKQNYYEYFYGTPASSSVEKDAGAPMAVPPETSSTTPGPSADSIKRGTDNTGFRDPNNKYPLPEYINEPDTNRLARGIIDGTVVNKKDGTRVKGVPKAFGGSWDQPEAPFGAKYPFNKVFETESGHIQEFDDTPGQERIHTYHRSGTFTEVDSQGTQVNYIVGDAFILMERNGCVHIAGECNITVDGTANILARTDANIEVSQNASLKVGNNLDISVATNITMAAGGDISMKANGDFHLQAANISNKADTALVIQSGANTSIKGDTVSMEAAGDMNVLSGGTLNVDYAEGQFGNGAASANDAFIVELTPADPGFPMNPVIPFLIPPERSIESKTTAETPDDVDTPEGRAAVNNQVRKEGVPPSETNAPVASEESAPSGGVNTKVPVSCQIIFNTNNFTNDFVLSKNFNLGMLIDGGVGGQHRLVDQMLKESKSGPERLYTVQQIVCNLAQTAQNILEPLLEILPGGIAGYKKEWKINSGYRLRGVLSTESPTSDHCKGFALDIGIIHPNKYQKTYEFTLAAEKILPYDQLILEYAAPGSCWMHVSYRPENRRKMAFTMVNHSVYKRDSAGIPNGFVLLDSIPAPAHR